MHTRSFSIDDQMRFARLSGDYNLLHIDEDYSRRLLFGSAVVHGVHGILWALDCYAGELKKKISIDTLKAAFKKPILLGEEVQYSVQNEDGNKVEIVLLVNGEIVTNIKFETGEHEASSLPVPMDELPTKIYPETIAPETIESTAGKLPLLLERTLAGEMFPHLMEFLHASYISTLLCSTYLVGMKCPGTHSLYNDLKLERDADTSGAFSYNVARFHENYGVLSIGLKAPGLTGSITASLRPSPKGQDTFEALKELINTNEFKGQKALVVGGSRGLGEVVSKLIAAGGGEVLLTYRTGREDAERVVEEIVQHGGVAECIMYDALEPEKSLHRLIDGGHLPTHVYYFATPHIGTGHSKHFSVEKFSKFSRYYVTAFIVLVEYLKRKGVEYYFNPSTVFIDDKPRGMKEYIAAKHSSEIASALVEDANPGIRIYTPRLPKMETDQTVSITGAQNEEPAPVMLDELRQMQRISNLNSKD